MSTRILSLIVVCLLGLTANAGLISGPHTGNDNAQRVSELLGRNYGQVGKFDDYWTFDYNGATTLHREPEGIAFSLMDEWDNASLLLAGEIEGPDLWAVMAVKAGNEFWLFSRDDFTTPFSVPGPHAVSHITFYESFPEPSSASMAFIGGLALLAFRRKRCR